MTEKEQRRFSRIAFRTTIEIIKKSVSVIGELKDLSLKGAFIVCREKIPVGQSIKVILHLGEPENPIKLSIDGRVTRTNPDGMAVEFESMDLDTFSMLKELVSYNLGSEEITREEILRYLTSKINRK